MSENIITAILLVLLFLGVVKTSEIIMDNIIMPYAYEQIKEVE